FGTGAVAVDEEAAVRLVEHQLRVGIAQAVAVQLVGAMGVVQLGEEQGAAVIGPAQAAVAVLEGQLGDGAVVQILDEQAVDLVAAGIQAVAQQALVGADGEGAQRQVAAVGQYIGVEQQLLAGLIQGQGAVGRAPATVMPRVLVAGGGALVVQPVLPGGGQRQVGLADAPPDLLEQALAQLGLVRQAGDRKSTRLNSSHVKIS